MKIFCAEQVLISGTSDAQYPMGDFFLRSDNTFTNSGKTLYTPTWSTVMQYLPVLVVRISRVGKCIDLRYAERYFEQVALGLSLVDIHYYRAAIESKVDPSLAYDFDGALVSSSFFPKETLPCSIKHLILHGTDEGPRADINLSAITQKYIHEHISLISRYYLLKMGDCITFPLCGRFNPIAPPERHLYFTSDEEVILNTTIA